MNLKELKQRFSMLLLISFVSVGLTSAEDSGSTPFPVIASTVSSESVGISGLAYSELQRLNVTCPPSNKGPSDSCDYRRRDFSNSKERTCFCDNMCQTFDDCCIDARPRSSFPVGVNIPRTKLGFVCQHLMNFGYIYMINRCHAGWAGPKDIKDMCENPDDLESMINPLSTMPTSNKVAGTTYRNYFCATCNYENATSAVVWLPLLEFTNLSKYNNTYGNVTAEYIKEHLTYSTEKRMWGIWLLGETMLNYFYEATIYPRMPPGLEEKLRECRPGLISECPELWKDEDVRSKCKAYQAAIYVSDKENGSAYRNAHCALCNGENMTRLTCTPPKGRTGVQARTFNNEAFSVLLDFHDSKGGNVGSTSACTEGQVYDPFHHRCKKILCGFPWLVVRDNKCVPIGSTNSKLSKSTPSSVSTKASNPEISGKSVELSSKDPPPITPQAGFSEFKGIQANFTTEMFNFNETTETQFESNDIPLISTLRSSPITMATPLDNETLSGQFKYQSDTTDPSNNEEKRKIFPTESSISSRNGFDDYPLSIYNNTNTKLNETSNFLEPLDFGANVTEIVFVWTTDGSNHSEVFLTANSTITPLSVPEPTETGIPEVEAVSIKYEEITPSNTSFELILPTKKSSSRRDDKSDLNFTSPSTEEIQSTPYLIEEDFGSNFSFPVIEEVPQELDYSDSTQSAVEDATKIASDYSQEFIDCPKITLEPKEYELLENRSLFVPAFKLTYDPSHYLVVEDSVFVCAFFLNATENQQKAKFSPVMGYITVVGLGISMFCLVLHLFVYMLVPDTRNLSTNNLACLSVSLLLAYISFIVGQVSTLTKSPCIVIAIAIYFFFLASFFWMSVMSFDVWRTLRLATQELRVSSGRQWKRFLGYSFYAWGLSAVAVIIALAVDHTVSVPEEFRPGFGTRSCWFAQRNALLVFFAAPLIAIMVTNILLFVSSARMILSTTQSTSKNYSCSTSSRRNFKLYLRLSVMMGLTWTIGLIAGYLNQEVLWYVFVFLNTLQGLFIFVAFTCNKKIKKLLSDKMDAITRRHAYRTSSLNSGSGFNSNSTMPSSSINMKTSISNVSNESTRTVLSPSIRSTPTRPSVTSFRQLQAGMETLY